MSMNVAEAKAYTLILRRAGETAKYAWHWGVDGACAFVSSRNTVVTTHDQMKQFMAEYRIGTRGGR